MVCQNLKIRALNNILETHGKLFQWKRSLQIEPLVAKSIYQRYKRLRFERGKGKLYKVS